MKIANKDKKHLIPIFSLFVSVAMLNCGGTIEQRDPEQDQAAITKIGFKIEKWQEGFYFGDNLPMVGNFKGTGIKDIIVFNRSTGQTHVVPSNGASLGTPELWSENLCLNNRLPIIGDFDGDSIDDVACVSPQNGVISYISSSTGEGFGSKHRWSLLYANEDESAIAADLSGNGQDDILIFNRSTGDVWGAFAEESFGRRLLLQNFSFGNGIPLVGDFNGDGRPDLLVVKPNGEVWIAVKKEIGFNVPAKWLDGFWNAESLYLVGDFDGNGMDDLIRFKNSPTNQEIWVALSAASRFKPALKWTDNFGSQVDFLRVGDMNGDGKDDLVAFSKRDSIISSEDSSEEAISVTDLWVARSLSEGKVILDCPALKSPIDGTKVRRTFMVKLEWERAIEGATHYDVTMEYKKPKAGTWHHYYTWIDQPGNRLYFNVWPVLSTEYCWSVRGKAKFDLGDYSEKICFDFKKPLEAPKNLQPSNQFNHGFGESLDFQWDAVERATNYFLEIQFRLNPNHAWANYGSYAIDDPELKGMVLSAQGNYRFRVRAQDKTEDNELSPWSQYNEINVSDGPFCKQSCASAEDCPASEPYCNLASGMCQQLPPECVSDSDCQGNPMGSYCQKDGYCSIAPGVFNCRPGWVWFEGECQNPLCEQSGCPEGTILNQKTCTCDAMEPAPGCNPTGACPDAFPYCNREGFCQQLPPECVSDADCQGNPEGDYCQQNGYCSIAPGVFNCRTGWVWFEGECQNPLCEQQGCPEGTSLDPATCICAPLCANGFMVFPSLVYVGAPFEITVFASEGYTNVGLDAVGPAANLASVHLQNINSDCNAVFGKHCSWTYSVTFYQGGRYDLRFKANGNVYAQENLEVISVSPVLDAEFGEVQVGPELKLHVPLQVQIEVYNRGNTIWRAADFVRLGSRPENNVIWNNYACRGYTNGPADARAFLCHDVKPGESHTFVFDIQNPPSGVGTLLFSAQMLQDGVKWFGNQESVELTITW